MKLLICIKQVPEITDVKINTETGTLMREGIDSILNPFCEYAVEKALELKEKMVMLRQWQSQWDRHRQNPP